MKRTLCVVCGGNAITTVSSVRARRYVSVTLCKACLDAANMGAR